MLYIVPLLLLAAELMSAQKSSKSVDDHVSPCDTQEVLETYFGDKCPNQDASGRPLVGAKLSVQWPSFDPEQFLINLRCYYGPQDLCIHTASSESQHLTLWGPSKWSCPPAPYATPGGIDLSGKTLAKQSKIDRFPKSEYHCPRRSSDGVSYLAEFKHFRGSKVSPGSHYAIYFCRYVIQRSKDTTRCFYNANGRLRPGVTPSHACPVNLCRSVQLSSWRRPKGSHDLTSGEWILDL